jgi:hypothetical protein
MTPIQIPAEWDDRGLITFEEFCQLLHLPPRTVRDWRRRHVGPRWSRFNGTGRLYITVAEARRFLASATPHPTAAATPTRETGARHD